MNAYDETYLPWAMKNLGEAFDYALTACKIPPQDFQTRFSSSAQAREWEDGSPRVLVGLSGTELARSVYSERADFPPPRHADSLSPQYWAGWALAYCHWRTTRAFPRIFAAVPLEEILGMYRPLHEESEDRFVDAIENLVAERTPCAPLRRLRERLGATQRELAAASGTSLRSIRHYEQTPSSIARAEFATVARLARALSCNPSDLMFLPPAQTR